MEPLYPAYLDISGRPVLVVGAGTVAARKIGRLTECGAEVTVIAPEVCETTRRLARDHDIDIRTRNYRDGDVEGAWLVVAATGREEVNRRVSADAERAGVFCNVVDVPALCSFQVPAIVRRGLLQLAISTGGASPGLARRLRKRLEEEFGPGYGELLKGLRELRDHIQAKYPKDAGRRRDILVGFLDSSAPDVLLEDGDVEAFEAKLEQWKLR